MIVSHGPTGKITRLNNHTYRAIALVVGYVAWSYLAKLFALTVITYFMSQADIRPKLDEISEALSANQFSLNALTVLSFTVCLSLLNPLPFSYFSKIFNLKNLVTQALPGAFQGMVLALSVLSAFLLLKIYDLLGMLVPTENLHEFLEYLVNLFGRVLALAVFIFFEEYLFRKRVLNLLSESFGFTKSALLTSIFYLAVKNIQFDLGILQSFTLFMVSLVLCLQNDFEKSAGYWMGILTVFHVWVGLPILGIEFSGVFLLKLQAVTDAAILGHSAHTNFFSTLLANHFTDLKRWVTGGAGGPLSSLALQLVLALHVVKQCRGRGRIEVDI